MVPIKNKKSMALVISILALLVVAGIYFFLSRQQVTPTEQNKELTTNVAICTPRSIQERASQLVNLQSILQIDNTDRGFQVSPEGRYLAVAVRRALSGSALQIYDFSTSAPRLVALPKRGEISAFFDNTENLVWMGTERGEAILFDLSERKVLKSVWVARKHSLSEIVLSSDKNYIGWFDQHHKVAGLFDVKNEKELQQWNSVHVVLSASVPQHIAFTPDNNFVLVPVENPKDLFQFSGLIVWDIRKQDTATILGLYVPEKSPGYAFAKGRVYYATRTANGNEQIRYWDPMSKEDLVFDPNPRSIHFIDLFVSKNGRFLAEGDSEDKGVRIYDLEGTEKQPLVVGAGTFVGWDHFFDFLLTTHNHGTEVWNPLNGKLITTIGALKNLNLAQTSTELSSNGCLLVAEWWDSETGKPVRFHVTVFGTPSFFK